jgi:hypothetical protein
MLTRIVGSAAGKVTGGAGGADAAASELAAAAAIRSLRQQITKPWKSAR